MDSHLRSKRTVHQKMYRDNNQSARLPAPDRVPTLEEAPMTYCVALKLQQGLVFLADTRTNAGVDNVSRVKKLFTW